MHIPSEGNLFTAKPEPLVDLLSGIHRQKTALPNFQRPWVWEPEMVRDLIVSVACRYPAGSLLSMPVTTTVFKLRPFEGVAEELSAQPNLMVLDGQQRLTSLYQALYRRDGVQVKKETYFFYLDVETLMANSDGIDFGQSFFDKALFYVRGERDGKRTRYEGLKPLYQLTTREDELKAGCLPLGCVFDADGDLAKWKQAFLVQKANNKMEEFLKLDAQWTQLVQPWLGRIRSYPFPMVELRADLPLAACGESQFFVYSLM